LGHRLASSLDYWPIDAAARPGIRTSLYLNGRNVQQLKKCWCYRLSNNDGKVVLVGLSTDLEIGVDLGYVGHCCLPRCLRIQHVRCAREGTRVTDLNAASACTCRAVGGALRASMSA
jgi:hypothetical protein